MFLIVRKDAERKFIHIQILILEGVQCDFRFEDF